MDVRSKRPLFGTAIASLKLHAIEFDTIYCKYSHSNQQIEQHLLALSKSTARMPESTLVDKKIEQYHPIMTILNVTSNVPHMP